MYTPIRSRTQRKAGPRAIDLLGRVHTFCCAVPGAWHDGRLAQAAGLSRSWFRHNIAGGEPYEQLDAEAAKIPVGANRLLYLPYLMGERTPHLDPDCRGAFIGLSAIHTKYDMLRAVMEGVVFSLKDCLDILTDMNEYKKMYTCGEEARAPVAADAADVFRLPVVTVKCTVRTRTGCGPCCGGRRDI